MSQLLLDLARAIAAFSDPTALPAEAAAEAAHLRHGAEQAQVQPNFVPGARLAHKALFFEALAGAASSPFVQALRAAAEHMVWHYGYPARPGEPDRSQAIAFAELIGPDAALVAPDCRIGLTLMARDTLYPMHAHPAVEIYRVIAGSAEWQTPQSARILPPGSTILHPSNLPHAMRTYNQPLLALYGWSGDIDTSPHYI